MNTKKELIEPKHTAKQVRSRISYSFWRKLTEDINNASCTEEIIRLTWEWMDERFMFSTHKQSRFEAESAEMALSDVLVDE